MTIRRDQPMTQRGPADIDRLHIDSRPPLPLNRRAMPSPVRFPDRWFHLPIVAAAGLGLGAIARLWMRWISDDPEFTWSGTIAIVVVITLFFTAQGACALFRHQPRTRTAVTIMRAACGILSLGIFLAAGGLMLPTVVGGGLALWRTDWNRWVRLVPALIALGPVAVVITQISDLGYNRAWVGRIVLFLAIYTVFTIATWPTITRHPTASTNGVDQR